MGRAPCCDKSKVNKGPWSPEEDAILKNYIEKNGTCDNWIALPPKAGLNRCGKSCRLRWLNYLRPHIKLGGFTEEEDNFICTLYGNIGSKWSFIASQLPGRTDNDVKNHWNTRLKKKYFSERDSSNIATSNNCTIETTSPNDFSTSTLQPQVEHFVFDQEKNSAYFDSKSVLNLEQTLIPYPLPMPMELEAFNPGSSFSSSSCSTPPSKEFSFFSNEAFPAQQNNHNNWLEHDDDASVLEFVLDELLESSQVAPSFG